MPQSQAQTQLLVEQVEAIRRREFNKICADCGQGDSFWAVTIHPPLKRGCTELGIFCCDRCYKHHTALSTSIGVGKSLVTTTEWTREEVTIFDLSGNQVVNAIYEANISTDEAATGRKDFISKKYKELKYFSEELYLQKLSEMKMAPCKDEDSERVVDNRRAMLLGGATLSKGLSPTRSISLNDESLQGGSLHTPRSQSVLERAASNKRSSMKRAYSDRDLMGRLNSVSLGSTTTTQSPSNRNLDERTRPLASKNESSTETVSAELSVNLEQRDSLTSVAVEEMQISDVANNTRPKLENYVDKSWATKLAQGALTKTQPPLGSLRKASSGRDLLATMKACNPEEPSSSYRSLMPLPATLRVQKKSPVGPDPRLRKALSARNLSALTTGTSLVSSSSKQSLSPPLSRSQLEGPLTLALPRNALYDWSLAEKNSPTRTETAAALGKSRSGSTLVQNDGITLLEPTSLLGAMKRSFSNRSLSHEDCTSHTDFASALARTSSSKRLLSSDSLASAREDCNIRRLPDKDSLDGPRSLHDRTVAAAPRAPPTARRSHSLRNVKETEHDADTFRSLGGWEGVRARANSMRTSKKKEETTPDNITTSTGNGGPPNTQLKNVVGLGGGSNHSRSPSRGRSPKGFAKDRSDEQRNLPSSGKLFSSSDAAKRIARLQSSFNGLNASFSASISTLNSSLNDSASFNELSPSQSEQTQTVAVEPSDPSDKAAPRHSIRNVEDVCRRRQQSVLCASRRDLYDPDAQGLAKLMHDSSISQLLMGDSQSFSLQDDNPPLKELFAELQGGSEDTSPQGLSKPKVHKAQQRRNVADDMGEDGRQLRRENSRQALMPRQSCQTEENEEGHLVRQRSSSKALSSRQSSHKEEKEEDHELKRRSSRKALSPRRSSQNEEKEEDHKSRRSSSGKALSPRRRSQNEEKEEERGSRRLSSSKDLLPRQSSQNEEKEEDSKSRRSSSKKPLSARQGSQNAEGEEDYQMRRSSSSKDLSPRRSSQNEEKEEDRKSRRSSSKKPSSQNAEGEEDRGLRRSSSSKDLSPRRSSQKEEDHKSRRSSSKKALSVRQSSQKAEGEEDHQMRRSSSSKDLSPRRSSQSDENEEDRKSRRSSSKKALSARQSSQNEEGEEGHQIRRSSSRKALSPRRKSKGEERGDLQLRQISSTHALSPGRNSEGSDDDTGEADSTGRRSTWTNLAFLPYSNEVDGKSLPSSDLCEGGEHAEPKSALTRNTVKNELTKNQAIRPRLNKSHSMRNSIPSDKKSSRLHNSFSSGGLHIGKSNDRSHQEPRWGSSVPLGEYRHGRQYNEVKVDKKSDNKSSRQKRSSSKSPRETPVLSDTDTEGKLSDRDTNRQPRGGDDSRKSRHMRDDRERPLSEQRRDHDSDNETCNERTRRSFKSSGNGCSTSSERDRLQSKVERFISSVGDPHDEDFWVKMIAKWEESV